MTQGQKCSVVTDLLIPPSSGGVRRVRKKMVSEVVVAWSMSLLKKHTPHLLTCCSGRGGEGGGRCHWKGCLGLADPTHNLLDHIQTVHVSCQVKVEGFVCQWVGCKVQGKKSSSLSWLERHVLSHSGHKPFKCIFPGCGLSFSAQGGLERHVNSHITTNGTTLQTSLSSRKLDPSSPFKNGRRKKQRCRKQRLNIAGQYVDFVDKRMMEVIKHRMATSVNFHNISGHESVFYGQVIARRSAEREEPQVLVHWHPQSIIPDEWMSRREYRGTKNVPLTSLPKDKLPILFPTLLNLSTTSPPGSNKGSRKWPPGSPLSSSSSGLSSPLSMPSTPSSSSLESDFSSLLVGLRGSSSRSSKSSSASSTSSNSTEEQFKLVDTEEDEGIGHCKPKKTKKRTCSCLLSSGGGGGVLKPKPELAQRSFIKAPLFYEDEGEELQDWATDLLTQHFTL